ncbi:hypothetical protein V8G54_007619 [Vigna mungo]|uniref:Uncharacterized protein n=1 Tax=Vigna mungo TaxID=3915 RepID=A0AAQ3S7G6_VIGMU
MDWRDLSCSVQRIFEDGFKWICKIVVVTRSRNRELRLELIKFGFLAGKWFFTEAVCVFLQGGHYRSSVVRCTVKISSESPWRMTLEGSPLFVNSQSERVRVRYAKASGFAGVGEGQLNYASAKTTNSSIVIQIWMSRVEYLMHADDVEEVPLEQVLEGDDVAVKQCRGKNLFFSTDVEKRVSKADIVFVMIVDVSKSDKIVVEKSTVPVKTAEAIERILTHNNKGRAVKTGNPARPDPAHHGEPEKLEPDPTHHRLVGKQGTTIEDLFKPDRVLIGGRETPDGQKAIQTLKEVYANWVLEEKIICTNLWSASSQRRKSPSPTSAFSDLLVDDGVRVSQVIYSGTTFNTIGFEEGGRGFAVFREGDLPFSIMSPWVSALW